MGNCETRRLLAAGEHDILRLRLDGTGCTGKNGVPEQEILKIVEEKNGKPWPENA